MSRVIARYSTVTFVALATVSCAAGALHAQGLRLPLRVDFGREVAAACAVPVRGGLPLRQGELRELRSLRLLAERRELPAQLHATAYWPDGSIKWLLADTVLAPDTARHLQLVSEDGAPRSPVEDPLVVHEAAGGIRIDNGCFRAFVDSGGRLRIERDGLVGLSAREPGTLRLRARCSGKVRAAEVRAEQVLVESRGELRTRILVRGHFAIEGFGAAFPARVLAGQPAGRLPFSLRYDFVRGVPAVLVQHQLLYTGNPDTDFVTDWSFALPGQDAGRTRTIEAPGLCSDTIGSEFRVVADDTQRLAWAPTRDGFVLLRSGFENRPCRLGPDVEFWPSGAGPWDLRRYAREWAVGETGNRDRSADIERYAKVAAYGIAKSHDFVLDFGGGTIDERRQRAAAFAAPALLVTTPRHYARSGALGVWNPGPAGPRAAELDGAVGLYLDYMLFNQELYRWHGPLVYGFWQTRNGSIHRHDRWDRDYGRWGWSLNDGAGRIGHVLMLRYLQTLERRYFTAGSAFDRAAYDTAMVHTERHLENATDSWWKVRGCSHRHGVQPFSGPYIGLRGSYPEGARIEWLLTGDGVLRDGLDLVIAAARDYLTGRPGAFGASGGSDGQGAAALALLHAHEIRALPDALELCRRLLDASRLIPPAPGARAGYGPDFGLFRAAAEYVELSGDEEFRPRYLALADRIAETEGAAQHHRLLATAWRISGAARYRDAIERSLRELPLTETLAELPPDRWPGHGGALEAPARAALGIELPFACAVFAPADDRETWPASSPAIGPKQIAVPADWWRPAGHQEKHDRPAPLQRVLAGTPREDAAPCTAGGVRAQLVEGKLALAAIGSAGSRAHLEVRVPGADALPFMALSATTGEMRVRAGDEVRLWVHRQRIAGHDALRLEIASPRGDMPPIELVLRLDVSTDPRAVQLTAPGEFRLERWRVDMNDERIPEWRNSDSRTRWPRWRRGGIRLGDAGSHRIYRQSAGDTAPVFVDEGFGSPGWFDICDRGGEEHWGITVRPLRDPRAPLDGVLREASFDWEERELVVRFAPSRGAAEVVACDVLMHAGWRPPLSPPDLDREQYARFLDDLDYGENIGLFALRHLLSDTHKIDAGPWKQRLMDRGIAARELLLGMQWRGALRRHCERLGVPFDAGSPDRSVQAVLDRYRAK